MARAVLICNPGAGRQNPADWLPEILPAFRRAGFRLDVQETGGPGQAMDLAREAAAGGADLVVAWGGDGTVNEVANGLAGTEVPLGVLPGGSLNLFAREIGIPREPKAALEVLLRSGERRRLGVGRAGTRYFLVMAGIGFDAYVIRQVPAAQKRALAASAYFLAAARHAWTYPFPPVSVRFDGKSLIGRQAVICNLRRYGGPFRLAPLADPCHPGLDLFLFQGRRPWDYLRYLYGILRGHHSVYRDVLNFKWHGFQVQAPAEPAAIQVDGEDLGDTPVEVVKVPDALTVIVSPA